MTKFSGIHLLGDYNRFPRLRRKEYTSQASKITKNNLKMSKQNHALQDPSYEAKYDVTGADSSGGNFTLLLREVLPEDAGSIECVVSGVEPAQVLLRIHGLCLNSALWRLILIALKRSLKYLHFNYK